MKDKNIKVKVLINEGVKVLTNEGASTHAKFINSQRNWTRPPLIDKKKIVVKK